MGIDLNRAREIFIEAVRAIPPAQWEAFLTARCGTDAALRRHVGQLLQAHAEAGSFLERPAARPEGTGAYAPGSAPDAAAEVPADDGGPQAADGDRAGTAVGPYKLLQEIGEGGMGTVFLAEQTQPVRRQVALKIIKPGMDSKQVIARFEAERQALALMDHPNIAKVLEAGATESGRPYFVMELVKGVPITRHCDERRLTPKERLELFIPVCQAVQHAHQKGVIHRDLKPSNVLVCTYDGRPTAKVIDFGVAKATGPRLTERTLFTEFGQVVGTLEYMSPEQAQLDQLDIDTRSDVYALGVLLYELLTGTTPLERKRLKGSALLEVLRRIREEEPPTPSTRLGTTDELPAIAANRGLEPKKLSGLVRGELDWIVMTCLEKDRNRRYETANALARDLQRYLQDEPVQACPPSAGYRLRKFVRRNKGPVLAVALVLLSLLAGVVVSTSQAVRARRAEADARDAQSRAEASSRQARQAVDRYYTRISENVLLNEPTLVPLRKQLLEDALHYYQGFARQDSSDPETLAEVAAANLRMANMVYALGSQEDWLTPMERAALVVEQLLQANAGIPASSSLRTGVSRPLIAFVPMPHPEEVLRIATRACAAWEELVRREPTVAGFRNDLAVGYMTKALAEDRMDEHAAEAASARRGSELLAGLIAEYPDVPHYRYGLALTKLLEAEGLTPLEQVPAAEQAEQQAVEIARALAVEFPAVSAYKELHRWAINVIAYHREIRGRFREAETAFRQELEIAEGLLRRYPAVPRFRINVLLAYECLAEVLWTQGRQAEAAAAYRRAVATVAVGEAEAPELLRALAWLLATCPDPQVRDPGRAAALATRLLERVPGDQDSPRILGAAQYAQGDFRSAARALAKAAPVPTYGFWMRGDVKIKLFQAMALGRLGEREQARARYEEALARLNRGGWWTAELRRLFAQAEQVLGLPPHRDQSPGH
jgi:serine/threonine protein kinase/tetratricopeptide (TPR) repeat protein